MRPAPDPQTVDTRIGKLSFTHDFANGYPTKETVERLYDERDFQQACQAYLWALPIVGIPQWQQQVRTVLGAGKGTNAREPSAAGAKSLSGTML